MLHVLLPDGMSVQIHAAEVDDPNELRDIANHDLVGMPSRWEGEGRDLDPVGTCGWSPLLIERLLLDAVGKALEQHRTTVDAADRAFRDGDVVANEVELRDAQLREEDLRRIRDRHLATGELEHLRLRSHGRDDTKSGR